MRRERQHGMRVRECEARPAGCERIDVRRLCGTAVRRHRVRPERIYRDEDEVLIGGGEKRKGRRTKLAVRDANEGANHQEQKTGSREQPGMRRKRSRTVTLRVGSVFRLLRERQNASRIAYRDTSYAAAPTRDRA